jgi:chaperone required for assembly of F1-ATPase
MTSEPKAPINPAIANLKDSLKPQLPKRFYEAATAAARDDGFAVLLDGRPLRTPARKQLLLPSAALAEAVAAEWRAQVAVIDPASMPLTRIVNSALDGVTGREAEVRAEIVKYAGGDLLLYRAAGPAVLAARQAKLWGPIVGWAEGVLGARFVLAEGIMPVTQAPATLDRISARIAPLAPLPLAALHVVTTLTGSALIALAVQAKRLSPEDAWAAAHVDEDHQIENWGEDHEAAARRATRWREMQAACLLLALSAA